VILIALASCTGLSGSTTTTRQLPESVESSVGYAALNATPGESDHSDACSQVAADLRTPRALADRQMAAGRQLPGIAWSAGHPATGESLEQARATYQASEVDLDRLASGADQMADGLRVRAATNQAIGSSTPVSSTRSPPPGTVRRRHDVGAVRRRRQTGQEHALAQT
jgi:uncharacterized membrane protein YdfJ with MMPL/SSD domain